MAIAGAAALIVVLAVPEPSKAQGDPVTATLTVSPQTSHPGETVELDASDSSSTNGAVVCDFDVDGDGFYEVGGDPDCIVNHAYNETGTYPATVRARDAQQASDTAQANVSVVENQPPSAWFTFDPTNPQVGEPVTLDATPSSDPDGFLVSYSWDLDGDGTLDTTESDAFLTHTFSSPGTHIVMIVVEDDDGASSAPQYREISVTDAPQQTGVQCTLSSQSVGVGEPVMLQIAGVDDNEPYAVDFEGNGVFDQVVYEPSTLEVTYDEPGSYTPQIAPFQSPSPNNPQMVDTSAVQGCGGITVQGQLIPPVAAFGIDPTSPEVDEIVDFDARDSYDEDGTIVLYRWDFDDDGTVDAESAGPWASHTYEETGPYAVRLEVEDNDGLTDFAVLNLRVEDPGIPWQSFIPFAGGLVGGLLLCRLLPWPRPFVPRKSGGGVAAYAAGTFEIPASDNGGPVEVTDVGFKPDLILLTASHAVAADDAAGTVGDATDGWSYGAVRRTKSNKVVQHVVGVADDTRRPHEALATARDDAAVHIVAHDGQGGAGGLLARVERITKDGFKVAVLEAPGGPPSEDGAKSASGRRPPRHVVLFRAFKLDDPDDAEIGSFAAPSEAGTQAVKFGVDADHVTLTALAGVGELGTVKVTDRPVGFSIGEVVADEPLGQHVAGGTVIPSAVGQGATAARDDRAVHLIHGGGPRGPATAVARGHAVDRQEAEESGQGRDFEISIDPERLADPNLLANVDVGAYSSGLVTAGNDDSDSAQGTLRGFKRLFHDAVHGATEKATEAARAEGVSVPVDAYSTTPSAEAAGSRTSARATGLGKRLQLEYDEIVDAPTAADANPSALVTYVAMRTGDATRPKVGVFKLPGPEDGGKRAVHTGFAPGMVELTVLDVDEFGERWTAAPPVGLGRSHGVAVPGPDDEPIQHMLSGAVDPDWGAKTVVGPLHRTLARASASGLMAGGGDTGAVGGAIGHAAPAAATIHGREDVAVTAFGPTGFDVAVTEIGTDGPSRIAGTGASETKAHRGRLVVYKAWPKVSG